MSRTLCAVVVAGLALVAAAGSRAALPSLYFHYAADCTFRVVDDSGAPVNSVPPGSYQVVVDTPFAFATESAACSFVQFELNGPGVAITTTLGTGDSEIELFSVTLQPSSTYVAQDDGAPARTRRSFTTAASGSPGQVAAAGGGPSSSSSGSGSKGGSSKSATSAIGTTIAKAGLLGTLVGTVGSDGRLTLTKNGKRVENLTAGRYAFEIVDHSSSSGFTVQAFRGEPITLSAGSFVGKRSRSITLGRGQWFFYGSFVGQKTYFVVTS